MNDRFKFRVWDKENKKFLHDLSFRISYSGILILSCGIEGKKYINLNDNNRYILIQSTGLKDINGELIYEGNIVEIDTNYNGTIRGKVYYDEQDIQIKIMLYYQQNFSELYANRDLKYFYDKYLIKVIGNIYENKELLE